MKRISLVCAPLFLMMSSCDTSQFDPSKHREKYEQERLNSNVKRFQLTEEGKLPEPEVPAENEAH